MTTLCFMLGVVAVEDLELIKLDVKTAFIHGLTAPYASTANSFMTAMVATWPGIAHVIGFVNTFMHNPSQAHWNAIKHVFR